MNRILLCLMLLVSFSEAAAASISVGSFVGKPQEMSNWCWAASIQSIFLTKGLEVEQADIVTAAYGRTLDGTPPNATAPGFLGTLNILNGLSVDSDGSFWRIRATAGGSFPNPNWLYSELSANRPVMIWYKDENSNHSIVVNGGEYWIDAVGNIQWILITAYDPWFDRTMKIDASNIPRYVYGTFIVQLTKLKTPKKVANEEATDKEDVESSGCPKETSPHGYIQEHCIGITRRAP